MRERGNPSHTAWAGCLLVLQLLCGHTAYGQRPADFLVPSLRPTNTVEHLQTNVLALFQRGHYAEAQELAREAMQASKVTFGENSTNFAYCLELLAGTCKAMGDVSNALSLCKRSLAIKEKALPPDHPDVATSLFALAALYNDLGNYAQALQMGKRSLQIREKAFGNEHQDVAASLAILSKIYVNQGDYSRALEASSRAFSYWEKHFQVDPYLAVTCLNDMASIGQALGNYDSSLRLYQGVLALYEKLYGADHPILAGCWNNIASIYQEQGNYQEALRLYRRSLDLKTKYLGAQHPDVALALNNVAETLVQLGRYSEALELYGRALSISEKVLGGAHPDEALLLNNIAHLYQLTGEPSKAKPLFQRSLQISERAYGNEHPGIALILNNLASVCQAEGNPAEALSLYERSLAMRERCWGSNHPEVISTLRNIATIYLDQSDFQRAIEVYAEAFRRQRLYFILQYSGATDKEAMRTIERDRFSEEIFHSLCGTELAGGRAAFLGAEELALNKGTLEEVRVAQAALESDPETATQKLRQESQAALARLERLPRSQLGPEQQAETRREIEAEVKTIDGELSERAPLAVLCLHDRNVTTSEIARSLPLESVLVDFVQFLRFDSKAKTNWWKERRYAAYLTFPVARDSTNVVVERVDLGEAAPVNQAVEFICKRMSSGMGYARDDVTAALQRLSDLVYAPLARHLTNMSHLIVCPDGQLSRVPFEMLRVGGRFLVEEKTISYVTSGREIVRLEGSLKPKVQSLKSLVMGGPDFDLDLSKAGSASFQLAGSAGILARSSADAKQDALPLAGRMPALRSLSRDYRGIRFAPLPEAETEACSVAKLLGGDCVLRVGPEAREAELKAAVSPRVLHLATHGFFLSDQDFKRTNALRDVRIGNSGTRWNTSLPKDDWENPLVRCGIALAGANHAGQITNAVAEDGVLTGLEASLLNLQGTELVILSACDSGTGEVQIGEGVMSLRRAFRIAGAQTVLASHWEVSDKATSQLMTEFIGRWRSGEPRAKAWREAQLSLLHSKEFSNPYFWAAFTMTGQWR
jgi:CHAT domain-containing protein/Tfp pilus assembly protein PilF